MCEYLKAPTTPDPAEIPVIQDFSKILPPELEYIANASAMPDVLIGEVDEFSTVNSLPAILPEHKDLLESLGLLHPDAELYGRATNDGLKVLHMRACLGDPIAQTRLFIEHSRLFARLADEYFSDNPNYDADDIRSAIYNGFSQCLKGSKVEIVAQLNYLGINKLMFRAIYWALVKVADKVPDETKRHILMEDPYIIENKSYVMDSSDEVICATTGEQAIWDYLDVELERVQNSKLREVIRARINGSELSFDKLGKIAGVKGARVQAKYVSILIRVRNHFVNQKKFERRFSHN